MCFVSVSFNIHKRDSHLHTIKTCLKFKSNASMNTLPQANRLRGNVIINVGETKVSEQRNR